MKQWLRTLLELTRWRERGIDPSASDLARVLKRDPSHIRRELQMMRASGYVRRIGPESEGDESGYSFPRPDTQGLRSRWQITERGLNRLKI